MSIVNMAIKIQSKLSKGKQPFFMMSIDEQQRILKSFKEPLNLIERSYFQYLCQMKQTPLILKAIQNLVAAVLTPYYYYKYSQNKTVSYADKKMGAVFIAGTKDISYVPETIKNEFEQIYLSDYNDVGQLTIKEKKVIKIIYKRYWYKPYFCLKCMMKIALYANQIYKYNSKAILTIGEFSFTSSVLTFYCNEIGVEHINIMHGEKLFNIRDSFVKFDRYYVWDQHYIDLMVKLRAEDKQFRIEKPSVVHFDIKGHGDYKYDLTYYLGGENKKDLYNIKASLLDTRIPLKKICIRYHPRFSDEKQIRNIFNCFKIENPNEVPLDVSVSITKFVVSLYSTVLYQAYENGGKIIIDDLSNPIRYELLKSLNYVMMNKPHILLSALAGLNKGCSLIMDEVGE
jgi:hypothetical protein